MHVSDGRAGVAPPVAGARDVHSAPGRSRRGDSRGSVSSGDGRRTFSGEGDVHGWSPELRAYIDGEYEPTPTRDDLPSNPRSFEGPTVVGPWKYAWEPPSPATRGESGGRQRRGSPARDSPMLTAPTPFVARGQKQIVDHFEANIRPGGGPAVGADTAAVLLEEGALEAMVASVTSDAELKQVTNLIRRRIETLEDSNRRLLSLQGTRAGTPSTPITPPAASIDTSAASGAHYYSPRHPPAPAMSPACSPPFRRVPKEAVSNSRITNTPPSGGHSRITNTPPSGPNDSTSSPPCAWVVAAAPFANGPDRRPSTTSGVPGRRIGDRGVGRGGGSGSGGSRPSSVGGGMRPSRSAGALSSGSLPPVPPGGLGLLNVRQLTPVTTGTLLSAPVPQRMPASMMAMNTSGSGRFLR